MKELENKIREALPRLKDFTKGCIVKDILNNWEYEVIDNIYCPQLYSYQYSTFRTLEFKDLENIDIIGHPIKLNDVLEYIKLKSNFKELFYYFCSVDQSENNESDDTFESNFRDYKNIFKDLYYDEEEGYHLDYNGDILYKAIVRTEIYDDKGYYNHRFIIEPNDFILRNWNLSSVFLADQSEELKEFLNSL